ncbi:MAG: ornithine cyclodeaminase family protein, partial [Stellaceae bacterium]
MALLLTHDDVKPLLDLERAIAVTEQVFHEYGRGEVDVHAPYHLLVREGALRVVSGALKESRRMGLRCGPTHGPPEGHVALLYASDGTLRAIMGYSFGTIRTAATVAASLKHMARPDAKRVGLIGTGANALGLLHGARAVRPVSQIFVYSRDGERRRRFAEEAARAVGVSVTAAGSAREAVAGMDIVITSTSNREPLFPFDWLDKGTHLSSMGPISELGADIFLNCDRRVVSSKAQEENYYIKTPPFPLVELIAAGRLQWSDVDELGEVIAGTRPGRAGTDEITLFHESQGGFGDMAFASFVYTE